MSANVRMDQGRLYGLSCIIDIVMSSIKSNQIKIEWNERHNKRITKRRSRRINRIKRQNDSRLNQMYSIGLVWFGSCTGFNALMFCCSHHGWLANAGEREREREKTKYENRHARHRIQSCTHTGPLRYIDHALMCFVMFHFSRSRSLIFSVRHKDRVAFIEASKHRTKQSK